MHPQKEEVCLQGDQGDEFFIIMEGLAIVTQCPADGEETKEVKDLQNGVQYIQSEVKVGFFFQRLISNSGRATRTLGLLWRDRFDERKAASCYSHCQGTPQVCQAGPRQVTLI